MGFLTRIRTILKALYHFRKACRTAKIVFPYSPHVATDWEEDCEKFFSPESISSLKMNLDEKSCRTLDLFFRRLNLFLELRKENYYAVVLNDPYESDVEDHLKYEQECKKYKKSGLPLFWAESLYFHHGLLDSSESVKNYIKGKIFIDGGACCGDSSLALLQYNPSKIFAFDISPRMIKKFHQVMKKNRISEDTVQLIPKGLGEKHSVLTFDDKTLGSTSLSREGSQTVEIVPLDSCQEINGQIGLIKFDLEGFGLSAFRGMMEILKRDRPVLALAVYHCGAELFGIKTLLDSMNLNYKVEYKSCSFDHYGELTMFAYPEELSDGSK